MIEILEFLSITQNSLEIAKKFHCQDNFNAIATIYTLNTKKDIKVRKDLNTRNVAT